MIHDRHSIKSYISQLSILKEYTTDVFRGSLDFDLLIVTGKQSSLQERVRTFHDVSQLLAYQRVASKRSRGARGFLGTGHDTVFYAIRSHIIESFTDERTSGGHALG